MPAITAVTGRARFWPPNGGCKRTGSPTRGRRAFSSSGPTRRVAPLVAAAIIPVAASGLISERIALAGALAVMVGMLMFVGGLARFGFVTALLSMPVRMGYPMGIAATVIVAQLPQPSSRLRARAEP